MKKIIYSLLTMFAAMALMISCSEDPAPPVVEIFAEVDQNDSYTVNFNTVSENATSFSWNFGDDETGSGATTSHTYAMSGDYTVTVTAMGDGGEAMNSKSVTIAASVEELLSGGPSAANGKTWVMSTTASPNDGAYSFAGTQYQPAPSGVLEIFGIGAEYDNEFTFKSTGAYSISPKNGNILASVIHAYVSQNIIGEPIWALGLAVEAYTPPSNATFTVKEGDLTVTVRQENPNTQVVGEVEDITFEDVTWIEFSENAYFGIYTYDTKVVIKEISSNRMIVNMLVSTLSPEAYPADFMKPSILYTLSFEAK